MYNSFAPYRAPAAGAQRKCLPHNLIGPDQVHFELPAPGQIRMRRLVHRGAPRPVWKVHSLKLGRVVQCESGLEVDAAMLLDACPAVTTFAEQPLALHYFDGAALRRHVPDFMVHLPGRRELIEIKFESTLDEQIGHRTARLIELLPPYGWSYRIVTETSIRSGHRLANVRSLLRRGRNRPPEHWSLATFDRIRRSCSLTLGDFGWSTSGHIEASWIAHEILVGNAYVDLATRLSDATRLLTACPNMGGVLPWLPVHSK